MTTIWAIWQTRNSMVFKDTTSFHHSYMILILSLIHEAQHFRLGTMSGIDDLLSPPSAGCTTSAQNHHHHPMEASSSWPLQDQY